MSKTIDERVVSMQFDNKNFEKNAAESMSTLEKLKSKLDFSGSSKAMKELDSSVKSVDMSPLANAAEAVKTKFSSFEQIAIGALRRIGDQAVEVSEKLIKSLTVDNLAEGWDKFGKKTNAVSTLVSQGYELETVNEQMEKLNWFTDETSYNFTAMASEIGKFTASGQGLEDSVTAMMGIANWAALSGQNATKASSAMYQLSQAMSKGALKYDDWKSIQNAGMDTKEVRQGFIDAAIALGQVKKIGEDAYTVVKEVDGEIKEVGNFTFNEMFTSDAMSKQAWIDTDAMMSVFSKYGQAVQTLKTITDNEVYGLETASEAMQYLEDKAKEMVDEANAAGEKLEMGDALKKVSMDAVMTIDSVASEVTEYYNSLSDVEKASFTTEKALAELGYGFDDFGLKALRSAQEARTWGDVIDATKDAVSTGWMNTFEQIFGDYEEAKTLWTRLANDFYDIFASAGEERNEVLSIWKEMGGRDLLFSTDEEHLGAIERLLQSIKNIMSVIGEASNEIFHAFEPLKTGLSGMPSEAIKVADAMGQISDESAVANDKAKGLYRITQSIAGVIRKVTDFFQEGGENLEKLKRTFKGLFAIVDIVKIAVKELFSALGTVFNSIFGDANGSILDLTANVGDAIVAFRDWVKESGIFKKVFGTVANAIITVVGWIKQFINWFSNLPAVQAAITNIQAAFESLKNTISSIFQRFSEGESIGDVFKDFTENNDIVTNVKNFFQSVWEHIAAFFGSFSQIPQWFSEGFGAVSDFFGGIIDVFKGFVNSLGIAGNSIGEVFENIKNIFSGLTINDYAMIALGIAIFIFVKKIFGAAKMVGDVVESFNRLTKAISGFFGGIKKALKAHAVLVLAASILALVGALVILANQDTNKLWNAVGVLGTLVGIITVMFAVIGAVGTRLGAAAVAVVSLSAAIALLGIALAVISKGNMNGAARAAGVLALMAVLFTAIGVIASRLVSDRNILKSMIGLAVMLAGMGVAMLLMSKTIKTLAELDVSGMDKVGRLLLDIAAALALIVAASSLVRKGAGGTILAAVASLYLIVGAIKLLNRLDPIEAASGLAKVQEIFNMFAKTLAIIGAASLGRGVKGVGASVIAMSVAIYALMGAILILGLIPADIVERGIHAVNSVMMVMALVLVAAGFAARLAQGAKSTEEDAKEADNSISQLGTLLLKMAAAMLGITAALTILSVVAHFNPEGLNQAAWIIGILMVIMTATLALSSLAKDSAKSLSAINVAIISLAVTVGTLAIISALTGMGNVIAAAGSLAIVMASLAVVIGITKNAKVDLKSFIAISAAVTVLGVIMAVLATMPFQNVLAAAGSMSMVMVALSVAVGILMKTSRELSIKEILTTLGGLVVIAGVMVGLLFGLQLLKDIDAMTLITGAIAVTVLLGVIIGMMALMKLIGDVAPTAIIAVGVLGAVIIGLAFSLTLMKDLDPMNAILDAAAIAILLGTLVAVLLGCTIIGPIAGGALAGLGVVGIFLAALAGVIAIACGIMQIPGAQDIMQAGVQFMQILGEGIGAFFGGIVGGFMKAASQGSAEAAANAMTTLYNASESITDLDRMQRLIDLGNMIGNMGAGISFAGNPEEMAKNFNEIASFAPNLAEIATTFSTLEINQANVDAVVHVGEMIAALAQAIPAHGGVVQWLGGDNTLAQFAEEMIGFAAKMPLICEYISQCDVDEAKVQTAVNVGKLFAGLAQNLPAHGGVVQWLGGDNTLPEFAIEIMGFCAKLPVISRYLDEVNVNNDKVNTAINVGKMFSGLAKNLPAHGGVVQWLGGDNNLRAFGDEVLEFSKCLPGIAMYLRTANLDEDAVNVAANTGMLMAELATSLPHVGGIFEVFTGHTMTLEEFGENIIKLGEGLKGFSDAITTEGGIDEGAVNTATTALQVLSAINTNLPDTGGIFSWFTGGDKDVEGFKNMMPKMAEGIRNFSNELMKDGGINNGAVSAAGEALAGIAQLGQIGDLSTVNAITEQLGPIAQNLKNYNDILASGEKSFAESSTKEIINSAIALSDLEKTLTSSSYNKTKQTFERLSDIVYLLNRISLLDSEKIEGFQTIIKNFGQNGLTEFLDALNGSTTSVEQGALTVLNSFISGVENNENSFKEAFTKICDAGIAAIREKSGDFDDVGKEISDGIITSMTESLEDETTGVQASAKSTIGSFDLSSIGLDPSSLFGGIDTSAMSSALTGDGGLLGNLSGALSSTESMDLLGGMGTDMFGGLMDGIDVSTIKDSITGEDGLLGSLGGALSSNESKDLLGDMGGGMMDDLISGFDMSSITNLVKGDDGVLNAFTSAFNDSDSKSKIEETGKNAAQGFINGAIGKKVDVKQAGIDLAKEYTSGIEETLRIASPSKETYRLGAFAGEGFLNALKTYVEKSYESGAMLSDSTMEGMKSALTTALSAFDSDVDTQPTIKPVIDLSEVNAGAEAINEVFGPDSTIGVSGNISAVMGDISNSSTINVDNRDVVKELNRLRSDIGVMADRFSKFQVYLDSGALVGGLTDPMDRALGSKAAMRRRG